jgi:hypothetical protein
MLIAFKWEVNYNLYRKMDSISDWISPPEIRCLPAYFHDTSGKRLHLALVALFKKPPLWSKEKKNKAIKKLVKFHRQIETLIPLPHPAYYNVAVLAAPFYMLLPTDLYSKSVDSISTCVIQNKLDYLRVSYWDSFSSTTIFGATRCLAWASSACFSSLQLW